jgi:hypothetical protein
VPRKLAKNSRRDPDSVALAPGADPVLATASCHSCEVSKAFTPVSFFGMDGQPDPGTTTL